MPPGHNMFCIPRPPARVILRRRNAKRFSCKLRSSAERSGGRISAGRVGINTPPEIPNRVFTAVCSCAALGVRQAQDDAGGGQTHSHELNTIKRDFPTEKPSPVGEGVSRRLTDEVSFSVMLILAWYIFLSDYETGGASPSPTAQMIIITAPR